jgi:hypothetical protein
MDSVLFEYKNGRKEWRLNGKLHRIDGPAMEWISGTKQWFINGKLHRTDGPAIELASGSNSWWVNGIEIDIEQIISNHELNPDWTKWTEIEKMLFRLAV